MEFCRYNGEQSGKARFEWVSDELAAWRERAARAC